MLQRGLFWVRAAVLYVAPLNVERCSRASSRGGAAAEPACAETPLAGSSPCAGVGKACTAQPWKKYFKSAIFSLFFFQGKKQAGSLPPVRVQHRNWAFPRWWKMGWDKPAEAWFAFKWERRVCTPRAPQPRGSGDLVRKVPGLGPREVAGSSSWSGASQAAASFLALVVLLLWKLESRCLLLF